tara:strand:- start:1892 stop:3694 length:1803 start_codon:yes stop_codon:yes gene_type:complete
MRSFYDQRITGFTNELNLATTSANRLSILRGLSFLLGFLSLVAFFSTLDSINWVWLLLTGIFGLIFYRIVILHTQKLQDISKLESLIALNNEEISRMELNLAGIEDGKTYLDPEHPYHLDLDIFGKHSLFQLLNRCQIPESKSLLANWLSHKAPVDEIKLRQEASKELAKDIDWYQNFMAEADISLKKRGKREPEVSQKMLAEWANKDYHFKMGMGLKVMAIATTIVSVALVASVLILPLTYHWLYLLIIPNGSLLGYSIKHLNKLSKGMDKAHYLIKTYLKTIPLIENGGFSTVKLKQLQQKLGTKTPAHKGIEKLSNLAYRLSVRGNMLYPILDGIFLLDAYLLIDLCNWKVKYQSHIEEWLEVINEMECLISLAGFSHIHPDYTFPEVDEQPFHFNANALGHPLIPENELVKNDYEITGRGSIDILTGSNMSGKSTFERTIGINMVLAQAGAPVNAASLSMGLTDIFTSMRTVDDISKHTSSFYAELKRINQLLETVKSGPATFVVIDEVLKGTNSEDRHIGAVALVKKLSSLNAFGIISTHDLSLGKETQNTTGIRNFSFNSEIKDNQILFDYKLTPGLCKSFNASKLMEKMGIID